MSALATIEDARRVWIDGHGEATVGELRASVRDTDLDSRARTIAMWGWIVTHPDEPRPWLNSGRIPVVSAGSIA